MLRLLSLLISFTEMILTLFWDCWISMRRPFCWDCFEAVMPPVSCWWLFIDHTFIINDIQASAYFRQSAYQANMAWSCFPLTTATHLPYSTSVFFRELIRLLINKDSMQLMLLNLLVLWSAAEKIPKMLLSIFNKPQASEMWVASAAAAAFCYIYRHWVIGLCMLMKKSCPFLLCLLSW